MKRGFSLIEVVISVSLLIMVGMAMVILNSTALKLMTINETTATAYGLNDRATGFMTAKRHQLAASFDSYITGLPGQNCTTAVGCDIYIACPTDLTQVCALTGSSLKPAADKMGRDKLAFATVIHLVQVNGAGYNLTATTSWGTASNQQVKVIKFLN
ncbi:MAG TPA: hypothetical protein VMQ44_01530 [Candidatus Saccharimonadales bacterium]|nr:hypothetical protein [Candidatus Saccharimonadales bacterium]